MSQTCVFLPPSACAAVSGELGVLRVRQGRAKCRPFAEAVARLEGAWTLVLPVEAVTACAVQLPTQKARWLRQALPFAVEDLLAEEVEQFHLALGAPLADGRRRVFAVRRQWLANWLALCPQPPQHIAVDADLLPAQGTQLMPLGSRWLLGGAGAARMALSAADWPALAAACASPHIVQLPGGQPGLTPVDQVVEIGEPYAWLARQTLVNDLAQGEFAVRPAGGHWSRWRPLAAVLGVWLLLQCGFNLAQGWHLQRQAEAYAEASASLYRELFPEDRKLINLRAQLDQHLAQAGGDGQGRMLSMLAQVSEAVALEGSQVSIEQVDFSDARGDLALQVQAPGFGELERMRERLEETGVAVQLGSASREATGVSARMVIGG